MTTVDDTLRAYLKREYPKIIAALETGDTSANERWLFEIASRGFRQGFLQGYAAAELAALEKDGDHQQGAQ
jgi:hypothetical protein